MRSIEIVLPRRSIPQPAQRLVPAGDCGACCLAGVMGIDISEVYEHHYEGVRPISWWGMERFLNLAISRQWIADAVISVPIWMGTHPTHMAWGLPSPTQSGGWIDYLRLAFGAGFYAIAQVNFERKGMLTEPNHWVVLCGIRRRWMPLDAKPDECRVLKTDVLVSCSARSGSEEWVDAIDFLQERGGFALLLVKPLP